MNSYFDILFRKYSTKKKIFLGFLLNICVLLIIGTIVITGIYRFYKWIDSTSRVETVLTAIYKTRTDKIGYTQLTDAQIIERIDSLSKSLSNFINVTYDAVYSPAAQKEIDTIKFYLDEFRYEYKTSAILLKKKYETQNEIDTSFTVISRQIEPNPITNNGVKGITEFRLSVISDINYELLKLKEIKANLRFQNHIQYSNNDLKTICDKIDRSIETINNPSKKELQTNVNTLENSMIQLLAIVEDLEISQRNLTKIADIIQNGGEKALERQREDFKKWGEINVSILILILLATGFGGLFLIKFFNKLIRNDEEYREITQRALLEKQKFLDNIVSNSSSLFAVKDVYGRYIIVNNEWQETFGKAIEEVIGKTDLELFPESRTTLFSDFELKALNFGISQKVEETFLIQNTEHVYLSNIFPILNEEGTPNSVCSISISLTPLREVQKALEQSELNYKTIVSNVPGIVFHCHNDNQRTVLFISDGVKALTGYSPGDFLYQTIHLSEIIVPEDLELLHTEIDRAVKSRRPYEIEYRIKDLKGQNKWVYERGSCHINDTNEVTLQGVIVDITEQKHSLESISSRDKFLAGVADAVKELIVNPAVDEALKRAMRIMGESANMDQSFVFKNLLNNENILTTSQLFVWQKGKITTSYRSDLQNVVFEEFAPRWYHTLAEKQEIVGNYDEFPIEERTYLELLQSGSLIIIPVFTREHFWGFIGFSTYDRQKSWTEPEKAIFKAFSVTLGIAIAKAEDSAALKDAKELAEAATKTKSDFLARMSHEIRTPMNAIIGWTHLAMERETNAIQSDYLRKIQSSSKALLGIINDILDFSKIEADKLAIEEIDFDLEDVMNDLSSLVSYKGQEKKLEMVFSIDPDVPLSLIGDPLRLTQVLVNLVNNAVKFTAKGEVVVNVKVEDDAEGLIILRFDVRDTGIGLTEDQLVNLFDSFSQADVSTTRKYGGTGLGLAICKRLTALMGGDIWVSSQFGHGSIFSFTASFGLQKNQKKNRAILSNEIAGLNVLICDQNASSVNALAKILKAFKCNPIITNSAETALKAMHAPNNPKPDIIFIDWKIERIEDVILKEVNNKLSIINTPVIAMLSNYNQSDSAKNVKALGLGGILYKPFNYSTILDVMMDALGKHTPIRINRRTESGYYLKALKKKKGLRILLVEDNETNQQIGVELIMMAGIKVDIAANGEEAVKMVKNSGFPSKYCLVFMDIQMPIMDGYKATMEIRKLGIYENLPIIAMTADAIGGALERYIETGMNGMVAKPIDPEEMYKAIHEWSDNNQQNNQIHRTETLEKAEEVTSDKTPAGKQNLPEIEGLNIEECLGRLVGRVDFFQRLISRFYFDHQDFEERFFAAIQAQDEQLASRMLHSFKGMMGTLSAIELYPLAIEVEAAYKKKDSSFDMKFKQMMGLLNRLLVEIANNPMFINEKPTNEKDKK